MRIKDAGANKREPPVILRSHKCGKYREVGDARRLKRRAGTSYELFIGKYDPLITIHKLHG